MSAYQELLDEREQLVLLYITNTSYVAPGFTTQEIMKGCDLDYREATQTLERLYVHRRIGRQKALLGGKTTYWMPYPKVEPLDLKGPPDRPIPHTEVQRWCECGRQLPLGAYGRCSSCRFKGTPWEDFDDQQTMVMLLLRDCGDRGLSFTKTAMFSREAAAAIQRLHRDGLVELDIPHERWVFTPKGRAACDDYRGVGAGLQKIPR